MKIRDLGRGQGMGQHCGGAGCGQPARLPHMVEMAVRDHDLL